MVDLVLQENKIFKWNENNAVMATDLYTWLGVKRQYSKWINSMLSEFEEGFDYVKQLDTTKGRPKINYIVSLDTAKEICMLSKSPKAREIRKYFIMIEKKYIKMYNELLAKNSQKLLDTQKQLVSLANEMNINALTYKGELYTTTEIAEEYGMSARKLNQILKDLDIQYKDNGVWKVPKMYQHYVEYQCYNYMDKSNTSTGLTATMKWTEEGKTFIDTIMRGINYGGFGTTGK